VYLFAKRDQRDGKWLVNPFDVFTIGNGDVVPPGDFSGLPKSLPVDTFIQLIYGLQRTAAPILWNKRSVSQERLSDSIWLSSSRRETRTDCSF
jgi:hypothetical protein